MKAAKTLRPPENWQDFETLCKKLWSEIWNTSDIKKNGRLGNNQNGVDIYGIPEGEKEYYGIQCKGKDEYIHKQLTKLEIEKEIEKAKSFKPPLKKLYFTTTAVKNSDIEQFIREKNIEHIENRLFNVELYSWEDIVDLIDENQRTHDYYVNSLNFKTHSSVSISFCEGGREITRKSRFKELKTVYKNKVNPYDNPFSLLFNNNILEQASYYNGGTYINKSCVGINIKIINTGIEALEDYKLQLICKCENLKLLETETYGLNTVNIEATILREKNRQLFFDNENQIIIFKPKENTLVGDDSVEIGKFFIIPSPTDNCVQINWKLLSKKFKDEGVLIVNLTHDFIQAEKTEYVDDINNQPEKISYECIIEEKSLY